MARSWIAQIPATPGVGGAKKKNQKSKFKSYGPRIFSKRRPLLPPTNITMGSSEKKSKKEKKVRRSFARAACSPNPPRKQFEPEPPPPTPEPEAPGQPTALHTRTWVTVGPVSGWRTQPALGERVSGAGRGDPHQRRAVEGAGWSGSCYPTPAPRPHCQNARASEFFAANAPSVAFAGPRLPHTRPHTHVRAPQPSFNHRTNLNRRGCPLGPARPLHLCACSAINIRTTGTSSENIPF